MKSSTEGSMRLDCNMGFGAATMVTGTFGFFAAAKAIEKYLKIKARQLDDEN